MNKSRHTNHVDRMMWANTAGQHPIEIQIYLRNIKFAPIRIESSQLILGNLHFTKLGYWVWNFCVNDFQKFQIWNFWLGVSGGRVN